MSHKNYVASCKNTCACEHFYKHQPENQRSALTSGTCECWPAPLLCSQWQQERWKSTNISFVFATLICREEELRQSINSFTPSPWSGSSQFSRDKMTESAAEFNDMSPHMTPTLICVYKKNNKGERRQHRAEETRVSQSTRLKDGDQCCGNPLISPLSQWIKDSERLWSLEMSCLKSAQRDILRAGLKRYNQTLLSSSANIIVGRVLSHQWCTLPGFSTSWQHHSSVRFQKKEIFSANPAYYHHWLKRHTENIAIEIKTDLNNFRFGKVIWFVTF